MGGLAHAAAGAALRSSASARPLCWSNSDTAIASKARPTRSPRCAGTSTPTLARSVEPTAVFSVTIWLWPRYSLPTTSARSAELGSKRTCSGRTPHSSSRSLTASASGGTATRASPMLTWRAPAA